MRSSFWFSHSRYDEKCIKNHRSQKFNLHSAFHTSIPPPIPYILRLSRKACTLFGAERFLWNMYVWWLLALPFISRSQLFEQRTHSYSQSYNCWSHNVLIILPLLFTWSKDHENDTARWLQSWWKREVDTEIRGHDVAYQLAKLCLFSWQDCNFQF